MIVQMGGKSHTCRGGSDTILFDSDGVGRISGSCLGSVATWGDVRWEAYLLRVSHFIHKMEMV